MRSFDQVKSWNRLYVLIGVLVFVLLVLAPSFFRDKFREGTKLAEYWISKPIQLGLDLVGGVYILFEVDQAKFLDQLRSLKINEIRNVLKKNEIPVLSYEKQNDTAIFRFVTEKSLLKAETSLEQAGYKILLSDKTKKELHVKLDVLEFEKAVAEAALKAVETIRARIDQFGVSEPVVQRIGLNRVLVELPGVKDLQRVKQVIGKTARLEFRFLPRTKDVKTVKMPLANTGELIEVEDEVVLTGDTIQKANVEFTPTDGAVVAIQFNFEGAREFARITRENREKNLAIIMDGVVYSAPQIQTAITEGSAIITGLRSPEEALSLIHISEPTRP
ncbi:MAG: hypothetical protein N2654_07495, partial [Deltaproteobacteria bacterium]|nr:hypothetical protein [Deltaproteobacteria bacterium]